MLPLVDFTATPPDYVVIPLDCEKSSDNEIAIGHYILHWLFLRHGNGLPFDTISQYSKHMRLPNTLLVYGSLDYMPPEYDSIPINITEDNLSPRDDSTTSENEITHLYKSNV